MQKQLQNFDFFRSLISSSNFFFFSNITLLQPRQHSDILNFIILQFFSLLSDFFERVMLTNSVVWQCSLTGRPELTYSEALASEKTARRLLRQFPTALRGPVILIASRTKRSVLKEMIDDVFNNVKDRYFKDEKLDVMNESGRGCRFCKIVDIIMPKSYE